MHDNRPEPRQWIRRIHRIENFVLCLLLSTMILLAFLQISGRLFLKIGFSWADPVIYHLVLWVSLAGAAVSTREHQHITIDVVSRALRPQHQRIIRVITDSFSTFVCGLLTWSAVRFVRDEFTLGNVLLGNMPAWTFQIILPLSFAVITARFCLHALDGAISIFHKDENP
ncbi:TRAP transporter small permease [bacterium]|nr:TRAP transporter small permease [candidate division CSSED10-310 bacterium]